MGYATIARYAGRAARMGAAYIMGRYKGKTKRATNTRFRTKVPGAVSRQSSRSRTEFKTFDLATINAPLINGASAATTNAMTQGPEFYQRIGRKIYMKSLKIEGFINNVATSIQDYARILVVYDTQVNGAQPPLAAILQNANAGAVTDGWAQLNMNNRQRFTILRDQKIVLPSVTNAAGAGVLTNGPQYVDSVVNQLRINMFIPLKGLETIYNSNNAGNTAADITSGAVFIYVFNSYNVNNSSWQFTFTTRLRYYD